MLEGKTTSRYGTEGGTTEFGHAGEVSASERQQLIAKAAYYRAEKRGFTQGTNSRTGSKPSLKYRKCSEGVEWGGFLPRHPLFRPRARRFAQNLQASKGARESNHFLLRKQRIQPYHRNRHRDRYRYRKLA